jgi:hypothetical protein
MNYYNGSYQASILDSLQNLYYNVLHYLPNLIAAAIVLLLGWLIAEFLGKLVLKILEAIKIDMLANRLGLDHLSERTGKKLSIARLGEWLIKWFFLVGAFLAASDILGLTQVSVFLYTKVFPYFGDVIVAVAILLIGMVAANFLSNLVRGTLSAGQVGSASALAAVTKWAIMIFAILAALAQLNIAASFLQDLFRAIVAMLAIAGGLAFGLGGKDHAKKVLDKIERDIM